MRLFPAHAGVILRNPFAAIFAFSVPRTRGGDPIASQEALQEYACSPHTRG